MQAACSHCGAEHRLDDAKLAGFPRVRFRCSKCGESTIVEVPSHPDQTQVISPLPEFARGGGGGLAAALAEQGEHLALPANKRVLLEVIEGPSSGTSLLLDKPRVIVGRSGADIDLADAGVSRWHCAVEVSGDSVQLRDLDSTNGTYFQQERVRAADLRHLSEFRLGASVLRLRIEPK